MVPTFLDLAHALRESAASGMLVVARMTELGVDQDAVLRLVEREKRVMLAADLLTDLAPQETLVRSLIDVGALAAFPAYSPNVGNARVGNHVLMRGLVCEEYPTELQVAFTAGRGSTRFLIDRRDLVGIERTPPTLWRVPER